MAFDFNQGEPAESTGPSMPTSGGFHFDQGQLVTPQSSGPSTDQFTQPDPLASVHIGGANTKSYGQQVSDAGTAADDQMREGFKQATTLPSSTIGDSSAFNLPEGVLKMGAGMASKGMSFAAPLMKPVSDTISAIGDKVSNSKSVQKFADSPTGKATSRITEDINNADTIAGAIVSAKGISDTFQGLSNAVQDKLSSMSKASADTTNTEAVKAAGQITQGKVGQAETSAQVLKNIDTNGVKTYSDLSNAIDTHIKDLKTMVDTEYEQNPTPIKLDDLTQNLKSGDVTAQANYVKDALDQLKELYSKTNDPLSTAKVDALISKASDKGLTPSEINQVARQYGTEFGQKAFSKTGDPLTSVNAQAYENTRSGIKDTARSLLEDDTAKQLDERMGDAIETKKLVDKVNEKVNALSERVQQRGVIEKLGRMLGKGVDMATFGGPRAFIQKWLFPSNVGLKTLNSLDLQDLLTKNLQKIQALETAPEETLPGELLNYVEEAQPGLSMKNVGPDPLKVAQKIGGADIPAIQNYLANPNSLDAYMKLQPLLESEGLDKIPHENLPDFFQNVIDQRNSPDFQAAKVGGTTPIQDTKTGRMQGSASSAPNPVKTVDSHFKNSQQIIDNVSPDEIKSMGGIPALVSRLKINIMDGLKSEGNAAASAAVARLGSEIFPTIQAFADAARKAVQSRK